MPWIVIVPAVIILGLIGLYAYFFGGGSAATVQGAWSTAPAAVHQNTATTFVYTVTKTIGGSSGSTTPVSGEKLILAVAPTTDVRIVSISDANGTQTFQPADGKITATVTTDTSGNVSVQIIVDHLGQGSITAIDTSNNAVLQDWTGVQ